MNRPESLDHLSFIERCLGCTTSTAIEVLERAHGDPTWDWRGEPGRLEDLAWKAFGEIRRRRLAAGLADPIGDMIAPAIVEEGGAP